MRIKEGFKMRTMLKEHIVTADGSGQVNFNKIISLNPTAAYLWENVVGKDFTESDLVNLLLQEYDVEQSVAEQDIKKMLQDFDAAGLLEI